MTKLTDKLFDVLNAHTEEIAEGRDLTMQEILRIQLEVTKFFTEVVEEGTEALTTYESEVSE